MQVLEDKSHVLIIFVSLEQRRELALSRYVIIFIEEISTIFLGICRE